MVSWNEKRQPSKSSTSEFCGPWVRHQLHYCASHCHWAHACIWQDLVRKMVFTSPTLLKENWYFCWFFAFLAIWSFFRKIRSFWNIFQPIDSFLLNWPIRKVVNPTSVHCHWMVDTNLSKCTFVVIGKPKISLTLPCMEAWWKGLKVDWYILVWWA